MQGTLDIRLRVHHPKLLRVRVRYHEDVLCTSDYVRDARAMDFRSSRSQVPYGVVEAQKPKMRATANKIDGTFNVSIVATVFLVRIPFLCRPVKGMGYRKARFQRAAVLLRELQYGLPFLAV